MRLLATLVLVTVLSMPDAALAHGDAPDYLDTLIHTAAAYRGANYWTLYSILRCESGGWDPRVINGTKLGAAGERGLAQIHPRGLGPLFESRGGDYSASDSVYFTAWAITHGLRRHWTC